MSDVAEERVLPDDIYRKRARIASAIGSLRFQLETPTLAPRRLCVANSSLMGTSDCSYGRGRQLANPAAIAALEYGGAAELFGPPSHETIHGHHRDSTPCPGADFPMLLPGATGETVGR
jgi:hypothetical protein